ncbi:RHS repeat-associated core domain-containing protein [Streptomyces sp. NPDC056462]|uniref:RHS repeat-associated core domain-containing protein n=1 Tax=Streptomyces sp. NPDC056462 TaxID=3345826 RepID=UPI0036A0E40C
MGYVLPSWLDEILDFIGINWPNVDEDDYREMADAMRELAEAFDDHAGEAHGAVNRLLSSSEGWAVDSLQEHWGKVKTSHLEQLPEVARLFADAMDVVADVIYGMKVKAEIELGVMAASVGISIGLAFVTGGLSALIGAAEIAAMREVVRRIIKEAADQIVDQVMAMVTEPVAAKLEKMVADAVLDLASGAISSAEDSGSGGGKGDSAMRLNSAGGSTGGGTGGAGGGGTGQMRIDHGEYDKAAGHLGRLSETSLTRLSGSLDRAGGANNRTRGKDPFTQGIDSVVDGATKGMKKAVERIVKHTGETIPKNLRDTSQNHKRNEDSLTDKLKGIDSKADGNGPGGGVNRNGPGGKQWNQPGSNVNLSPSELSAKARAADAKCLGGDPIDMATGEMFLSQDDVELPGILALAVTRTHLSTYRHGRFFGRRWASTFDERLERGDGGIWWHRTDGSSLMFPREPDMLGDQVFPLEGAPIPLTCIQEGNTYALVVVEPRTGLTRLFDPAPGADGLWWLCDVSDRNGNHYSIERHDDGTPHSILHSGGYHLEIHRDEDSGKPSTICLRHDGGLTEIVSYRYDSAGNLDRITNSSGLPFRLDYDSEDRVTGWTDRNDSTYQYIYDDSGRVVQTVGPDGYMSCRLEYDRAERTTRYIDSTGAVTTYRMNARGQVIAEIDPLGNTTLSERDRQDNLLSRTDPLGNTTRYEWDEHSADLTAVHFADGTTARTRYNRRHLPIETVLSGGEVWRQEYDARGNRTSVTAPDTTTTRFTHDDHGAVASVIDAMGNEQRIVNDDAGLPLAVTDPAQNTTSVTRDAFGRATHMTDALGARTELEWTVEGRLSRRTLPDGSVETWTWDGEGNCLSHTDPAGGVTTSEYTHFDQLAARTGPDGTRYRFAYDSELRLVQVLNPHGLSWDYAFDRCGRLVSETDFDDRTLSYTHDAAGRLSTRTTPLGEQISYENDELGRTLVKDVEGRRTAYAYDSSGRMVRAASPSSTITMEWDLRGRLAAETVDGATTTYHYDALGRRTQRITPTGACTELVYDASGNRTGLTASGHSIGFQHDALGKELLRSFGPGEGPVTFTTAYDLVGRPIQQSLSKRDRTLRSRAYTFRADHHLTSVTDQLTGATSRYELDPAGRPVSVTAENWSESYAYDAAGNQTDADWPETAPHEETRGRRAYEGTRLLTAGRVRYEYDAAGRTILRQKARLSKKPDTWRYEYDPEDRLTSCVTPDGTVWRYTYDPLGRRTSKQRLSDTGDVAEEVRFTWDGTRIAEQTDSHTRVTLTWDHDGHRPLSQTERRLDPGSQEEVDRRFFAIVTDLVGTPTELVDETGRIAWHSRPTVWGTTAWNRDATAYTPLRFPGQYADLETGLHYNFHRHYDPDTARFTSPDPLGLVPAPNPYAYVHNPHTWCDPLGLAPATGNDGQDAKKELMDLGKARVSHVQDGLGDDDMVPGAYAVGKDRTTGKIYYGESGAPEGHDKAVNDAMPGESQHPSGRPPGVCAEPRMFTNAINDGADPKNIDLVTVNPKGKKFKMCDNCKTWVPGFGGDVLTG